MKTIRSIVRDRLWNGAIVVSLAYLMVLQGIILSVAHGAMAPAGAPSPTIICTSNGVVTLDPAVDGELPPGNMPPAHCATLCQLASTIAPAVLDAGTALPQYLGSSAAPGWIPSDNVLASSWPGRIAAARAPPFFI